jgi:hypothetical protein
MLVCPATTAAQVETLRAAFDEVAGMMAS